VHFLYTLKRLLGVSHHEIKIKDGRQKYNPNFERSYHSFFY
jgi:hypothetical protein